MVWLRDLWHDGSLSSLWLCLEISVRDCEYFLFLLLRLWCSLIPTIYFSDMYGSRGPGNWFFFKTDDEELLASNVASRCKPVKY